MAFSRLGLPDEFCELFSSMDEGNKTVVLTAYGTSSDILGDTDGTFECLRGYAQGCTTSAAIGWTSFYDIFLSMQNEIGVDGGSFRVVDDTNGECDRSNLAFADDMIHQLGGACTSSPRRSAELKLAVAALFFDFTGIKFNPEKTLCCAIEFPEASGTYTSTKEDGDWRPQIYDLDVIFSGGELCLLSSSSTEGRDHIGEFQHCTDFVKME